MPPFSSVAYANGTVIQLLNLGAGVVTVTAGAGVTLNGSSVAIAQNTGGTLIKTATNTWYFLPSASAGAGMDLITPTSVVGGTLSGGKITFSAATEVSVNGCFTSTYDNYKIVFEGVQSGGGNTVAVRLRASGTNASGSNYTAQRLTAESTVVSGASATTTYWDYVSNGNTNSTMAEMLVRRPNLAETTLVSYQGGRESYTVVGTGYHSLTTQYDGFSIIPTANTITGTMRVYGLRNS